MTHRAGAIFCCVISITSLTGIGNAMALSGDTNGDGHADSVVLSGNYVEITDGNTGQVRDYYLGSGTKTLHSLQQLDNDNGLEVVVTRTNNNLNVIDDTGGSPETYYVRRNGGTGSLPYVLLAVAQLNSEPGNELVVQFPGDTFLWIISHYDRLERNYIAPSDYYLMQLIDTDGRAGKEVVFGYDDGSVTVVHQMRTPYVLDYHENVGFGESRIFGFTDTDGQAGSEIVLYYPGGSSIYVIRDATGSYGSERSYYVWGEYEILRIDQNRDGRAGNDICYVRNNGDHYILNAVDGRITSVNGC